MALSISSGDRPAEAQMERDAWAEHFRLIGDGTGLVDDRVWANVPSYPPHGCCLGRRFCPQ